MIDKYQQLLAYVVQHNITHVSFDIFDTLVFRHVHSPTELFTSISTISGHSDMALSASEFATLREQAERVARKKEHVKEDITLIQIYAELPFDNAYKIKLMEAELLTEKQCYVLNEKLIRVIDQLSKSGVTLCLISDMYLSSEQIRQTYLQNTILQNLPLYVSSEQGLTKFSGKLFSYVATELGLDYAQWLHVGDNIDTDVRSAQAAGLHAIHFHPIIDSWQIRDAEKRQFQVNSISSADRLLAALDCNAASKYEQTAYEIGAFVWGPILAAFSDWVVRTADKTACTHLICLMREAYVFAPLLNQHLKQIGREDLTVVYFYVSRKAAFFPSIDVNRIKWLEELMDTLMSYRGYTLENFIDDFGVSAELLDHFAPQFELKNIEGVFVQGEALYTRLFRDADKNRIHLIDKIQQQRSYLKQYFKQVCPVPYSKCAIVDFGNGGTIQHSLEKVFEQQGGANLLFYSTGRIYRFINDTVFHSFIPFGNDKFNVSETLARSPECIEALLLGEGGSTLEYKQENDNILPVIDIGVAENRALCEQFLAGMLAFVKRSVPIQSKTLSKNNAIGILARYIVMPTPIEASIFTQLLHQDNFGTKGEYPVISVEQCEQVKNLGLDQTFLNFLRNKEWERGNIHWPNGVLSLSDSTFLPKFLGLAVNDNLYYIQILIKKIQAAGWKRITVYGAGDFYLQMCPYFQQHQIDVDCLVDRRAEVSGQYELMGKPVVSLQSALTQGKTIFVVCSMAFRTEITNRINEQATSMGRGSIQLICA
ncbi:HAD-IA family hydrolase [Flavobacterium sp. W21_SRS_FM6]|uniref:HAD-IA family hydrolase n=1 Tax=Flavobacterium sp. W21_SRS_FM6 TaxID=3240268 RepID=UPI003F914373